MDITKKIYKGQIINKGNSNNDLYLCKYEKSLNLIIHEDSEKIRKLCYD